jgi:hypothetical protein
VAEEVKKASEKLELGSKHIRIRRRWLYEMELKVLITKRINY